MKKIEVKYGLPEKVVFCKKCVISNQRPNSTVEFKHTKNEKKSTIAFDQNGICSACLVAQKKEQEINWKNREKELTELLDKYRRNDGYYDVIVPGSGGKDSIFASYILKNKYGMHPLTVTWPPHIYTGIGFKNFENWIATGIDNVLMSPNGQVHRLLTRLAFENLLHPFQPFIIGQKNVAPKIAVRYKVPLIMYGENEAEYGNPSKDVLKAVRNKTYFSSNTNPEEFFLGGVVVKELYKKYKLTKFDLEPYFPVTSDEVIKNKIEVHYLGYYLKWDPQEMYYFVTDYGFRPNTERTEGTYSKYNSIDDRIDGFHYWTTYIKFGIGRATYDAAQEIRNKKITREEGVSLVQRYDGEFPKKYFKEILEYMDINEERFWHLVNKARSPHLWKKTNGKWKLRYAVSGDGVDDKNNLK